MNWETLLCLGDSITFGARSYSGYPEMCGELLHAKLQKEWHVINHATNGFTTIDLVRSISPQMLTYKNLYPSLITVMIGTNDIKNNTSADDFITAYRQLIVKMKLMAVNNNILLLSIPRLSQKVFYPYNFSMNEKVNEFNQYIDRFAAEYRLRTLNVPFDDDDFYDGVHLNKEGSHKAASILCDYILKDKGL